MKNRCLANAIFDFNYCAGVTLFKWETDIKDDKMNSQQNSLLTYLPEFYPNLTKKVSYISHFEMKVRIAWKKQQFNDQLFFYVNIIVNISEKYK